MDLEIDNNHRLKMVTQLENRSNQDQFSFHMSFRIRFRIGSQVSRF